VSDLAADKNFAVAAVAAIKIMRKGEMIGMARTGCRATPENL
jgi:hypothetical protein